MKIYRTSQYNNRIPVNKLVQDWSKYQKQSKSIAITGTNANKSITFNGKTIAIRPLLEKAVNMIRLQLINNGVREIDTSPLPPNSQGLAVSSEPGKIHIDVEKITNYIQNSEQPPVTQTDGTEIDPDVENHVAAMITRELLGTMAHESKHMDDYNQEFNKYQKNPNSNGPTFNNVQEAPGPAYEQQILNQYNI